MKIEKFLPNKISAKKQNEQWNGQQPTEKERGRKKAEIGKVGNQTNQHLNKIEDQKECEFCKDMIDKTHIERHFSICKYILENSVGFKCKLCTFVSKDTTDKNLGRFEVYKHIQKRHPNDQEKIQENSEANKLDVNKSNDKVTEVGTEVQYTNSNKATLHTMRKRNQREGVHWVLQEIRATLCTAFCR